MADTTRTPEQQNALAQSMIGQNLSVQDMVNKGLSNTEAQSISKGFTGTFGDPSTGAIAWRSANHYTTDNMGNLVSNLPISQQTAANITNPTLPANTTMTPTLQQVQGNELMPSNTGQLGAAPTTAAPTQVQPQTITGASPTTAATVDPNAATAGVQAQTVDPTLTTAVTPGVAAQGQISPADTVQGQLATLFASTTDGKVPAWASAAYNKAQENMAARGMASSSISAAAITQAYMQSALPIAAQDATTYFNMDMKNLDNNQATAMQNLQNRQQDMLTDVSISNAAKQFNATSAQQTQQFVASLISQIQGQNADRVNSVSEFNTTQANSIAAQNANNKQAADALNAQNDMNVDEFNSNLVNSRDQFNASMAFAIDQSNVLWRRSVNTADTAAINAANQTNVQNLFNLSASSQNQVWQQMQDSISMAFQAAEDQANRDYNSGLQSTAIQEMNKVSDQTNWATVLGGFGSALLSTAATSSTKS